MSKTKSKISSFGLAGKGRLQQKLTISGGILIIALAVFFLSKSKGVDLFPGYISEITPGTALAVNPSPEPQKITIEFVVSGNRDMALQILDQSGEEVMSQLFAAAPYTQHVVLDTGQWAEGKYTARLYNHREMVTYEFRV